MRKPRWELVITSTREEQVPPPSDTAGLRPQLFDSRLAALDVRGLVRIHGIGTAVCVALPERMAVCEETSA
jgi:hypothetical protein